MKCPHCGSFYYIEKKTGLWKSLAAAVLFAGLMVLGRIYNITTLL